MPRLLHESLLSTSALVLLAVATPAHAQQPPCIETCIDGARDQSGDEIVACERGCVLERGEAAVADGSLLAALEATCQGPTDRACLCMARELAAAAPAADALARAADRCKVERGTPSSCESLGTNIDRVSLAAMNLDELDHVSERGLDLNNDGRNELYLEWGCGTSGCEQAVLQDCTEDTVRTVFSAGEEYLELGSAPIHGYFPLVTGSSSIDFHARSVWWWDGARFVEVSSYDEDYDHRGADGSSMMTADTPPTQQRRWEPQTEVRAAVLSLDGERVITASSDKRLRVLDADSGDALHELAGHGEPVDALAVLPGNERFVAVGDKTSLRIWTLSGEPVLKANKVTGEVLAVSPDGALVAVGAGGGGVTLVGTASGETVATLDPADCGGASGSTSLAFDAAGEQLATSTSTALGVWRRGDDGVWQCRAMASGLERGGPVLFGDADTVLVGGQRIALGAEARPSRLAGELHGVAWAPRWTQLLALDTKTRQLRVVTTADWKSASDLGEVSSGVDDASRLAVTFSESGRRMLVLERGDASRLTLYEFGEAF